MKTILCSLLVVLVFSLSNCSNMTPEQQAQWSATANNAATRATDIALDEAAARLHKTRNNK